MHGTDLVTRRELLRIGALGIGALGLGGGRRLAAAGESASVAIASRAKRCIFIMLQGGPSHLDLWDPKPAAPVEVRGPFGTIPTALPGVCFGQLVPKTAQIADRLAVVRSMTHAFNNHIAGTYITLTGSAAQPNQDREAHADDSPGPGAVLNYLASGQSSVPCSVSLPNWLSIPGPSNRMPGQYGGFLGPTRDPFLVSGDPNADDFRPLALALPEGLGSDRLASRWQLRNEMDQLARRLEPAATGAADRLRASAYELLVDPRFRQAMELNRESAAARERYGRTKFGQSLLLAARLAEAGVQWIGYNAFNQEWDTHGGLQKRYEHLIPPMDQAFAALVSDLAERGLLDETLVVLAGEFGRTPIINKDAGRDHWPNVYSVLLAGGGIRSGLVLGASDRRGAQVASRPVSPADLLATIWHQLGIDPHAELRDRFQRPQALSRGEVVAELV